MKQITFASIAYTHKKVTTKREAFLNEMERVVPWSRLLKLIEPYYPKAGNGRPPMPMETMLRIYFLQQWYSLSDPAAEEALYDIESMRRFAQLELLDDAIPDETTILKFRHMIERHALSEAIFADINNYLVEKGIQVSQGSMVDATIIQAASSSKNKDKKRDAEMHSTRKNNQYYFGMKIHIGTDVNSNAIHSATITPANTADITELPKLLRERDRVVCADAGYTSDSYKKVSAGIGHELESQRQTKSRERDERIPEKAKQKELIGASSNRTLLQSDQMSIWLPKSPIQRTKKESGTSIHFIGIGQFVHAQRKISGMRAEKREKSHKKP